MLKSCRYCGRIHDSKYECSQKKKAKEHRWNQRKDSQALKFRKTSRWTNKSLRIRQRDKDMCLCCKALLPGTKRQFNTENLSVHHIEPIEENYDLRLDDDNLITVCDVHHEMCEAGIITREEQKRLVRESAGCEDDEEDTPVCL